MRLIDADALERMGYVLTRTYQQDKETMVYETKNLSDVPSAQPESCELCSNLEKGDTLYQFSDWDGGIGFDYIMDIRFCPKCGRSLE